MEISGIIWEQGRLGRLPYNQPSEPRDPRTALAKPATLAEAILLPCNVLSHITLTAPGPRLLGLSESLAARPAHRA